MKTLDHDKSLLFRISIVGLLAVVLAPLAIAQTQEATYVRYFITTVNHDGVAEFEDLLKERAAGLKTGGRQPFRSVYQVLHGVQYRYLMVDSVPSLAVLDQPPPSAGAPTPLWASRMDAVQSAQQVVILRAYPELNIPPAQGAARNLVRMRIRRTAPGRTQDYYEWAAKQLVPALRGAGVRGVLFGRVILGDSPETWITVSDEPSFAAMGTDVLAKSMGAAQSAQMLGRGMAMLVHTEDLVMRYRPDLGFVNEKLQN